MSDDHAGNEILPVGRNGFVALWRGQYVQAAIGGGLHYFATERDALDFLQLCDAANGIPTPPPSLPTP
jgi:hypothetical protein